MLHVFWNTLYMIIKHRIKEIKEFRDQSYQSYVKSITSTENVRKQSDNTKTPPKRWIRQRLRTDSGWSVGVTTATKLVWLDRLIEEHDCFENNHLCKLRFAFSFLKISSFISYKYSCLKQWSHSTLCSSLKVSFKCLTSMAGALMRVIRHFNSHWVESIDIVWKTSIVLNILCV